MKMSSNADATADVDPVHIDGEKADQFGPPATRIDRRVHDGIVEVLALHRGMIAEHHVAMVETRSAVDIEPIANGRATESATTAACRRWPAPARPSAAVPRLDVAGALDHVAHLLGDADRVIPRFVLNSTCFRAPAVGLLDCAPHRIGKAIGVEDRPAVQMAGGAAYGLDERALRAQETLLVGVEDSHQRHFGRSRPSRSKLIPTSTSIPPAAGRE